MSSLTLKITSYQSQTLGADSSKTFTELGGTIGRAQGNDWVLPDPERYISSRHASISFQDGQFYLTDTSTNGVYVNGADAPVGNGCTVALNNGDRLNFGDYEVEVSIDAGLQDTDLSGPWAAPAPADTGEQLVITSPTGRPDMPETLDPLAFTGEGFPDAFAQPPAEPGAEPDHVSALEQSFQPPGAGFEQIPEDWDMTDYAKTPGGQVMETPGAGAVPKPGASIPTPAVAEAEAPAGFPPAAEPLTPPPAAAVAPQPQPVTQPTPVPGVTPGAGDDMFAAFLRGAGLDPASVGQVDSAAAMQAYGSLFREVVQGLMEVLMARASLKSEFRMPLTTIRPVENNPLKFSPTVDDALRNLFLSHGSGYLSPEESVREGFADIKCHQMAMVAGMQAAFREMLKRFEPDSFDDRDKSGRRAALVPVSKKSRLWDAYCEFFRQVTRDPDTSFQTLFGEEFARAYEEQIRRLSDLRRT